jgi:aspartyl protease family protein
MATGFIMMRHSIALLLLLASLPARAADVSLIGTFDTKAAILSIDGGAPKTVRVGQSAGGFTVISVERDRAVVEKEGKRVVLIRGQGSFAASAGAGKPETATLTAGFGGHYAADGSVNGSPVRFIVDTGATMVALPGSDAERLGIDYRSGPAGMAQTASGTALVYRIKLDVVRIGGIELNGVDAVVIEKGLTTALLGMSFLNRVEMKHDGGRLTMTRRF